MAEKAVLSAMMRRPDWIARGKAEGITADSFHLPQHRELYACLTDWKHTLPATDNGEIDVIGFISHLSTERDLLPLGGPAGIMEIHGYAITLSPWPTWCEQLREMKCRRRAILAAQDLAGAADSA
jgi:replicative DNA helicase